jgi:tricorn protease
MISTSGYYRYPSVYNEQIVFVSEDDLWMVPLTGGAARRLTTGLGSATYPKFSPDGQHIAFCGTEEGHTEVYVMPSSGGPTTRLTFLGDATQIIDWTAEGIIFSSSAGLPFSRFNQLFIILPEDGEPRLLPTGPASYITYGNNGKSVLQRHGYREYSYWKRYRGGTAGELWIDAEGNGNYSKLLTLASNLNRPLWIKDRIYFGSDHEGVGNIYSCLPDGSDIKRHTHHTDFYTRNHATDGRNIVYHAGGDLYTLDLISNRSSKVVVTYASSQTQRNRKFVSAGQHLEDYALHPNGDMLAAVSRGKSFYFSNWEGAALQFGEGKTVRYRLARWLHEGKRLLVVTDEEGEERLEIYDAESLACVGRMPAIDIGRVIELKPSPTTDAAIFTNHRNELIYIDLKKWKITILDHSKFYFLQGFDWSPDGAWVAYNCSLTGHTSVIKITNVLKPNPIIVTKPVLRDVWPAFDPNGKYLYFIGHRQFNPTHDMLHFELSFPRGSKPYLITLQKDLPSPFKALPKSFNEQDSDKEEEKDTKKKSRKPIPVKIDFENIQDRIVAFPVPDGIYTQVAGIDGKVLFSSQPIEGTIGNHSNEDDHDANATVQCYDFETHKIETLYHHVSEFEVSQDYTTLAYRSGNDLRIVKAGEKIDDTEDESHYSKKNGWIDLDRLKLSIQPAYEWQQMMREAWRLQRDHYWTADMSNIDWEGVFKRYHPLLARIGSREEFSDLVWEMQGELGTSHAYVYGGDLRQSPHYSVGSLAAEYEYDTKTGAYRIYNIAIGDIWDDRKSSPLVRSGILVKPGDLLWAINGRNLTKSLRPECLLVNYAGQDVRLTVSDAKGKHKRNITVQTLHSQTAARYRDWVEKNRAYVHKVTGGRVGYLHIPDMSARGFAEFHRGFLAEADREGLIVDLRFNGGGNVSALLLEKLARRRLGFDQSRWLGYVSYPADSPAGPMAAITNEHAGSDGDIFSHSFKMMKLGPLIGKRTWGGVIGIWPRHTLADGATTTQPEFSFWFSDVGWKIENYGVEPDIEVEITPQDYVNKRDPQLDRGIEEVLKIIKDRPGLKVPESTGRPDLSFPELPDIEPH